MSLGISSYAYVWRRNPDEPGAWTLHDMLRDAAGLGAAVFQVCDVPEFDALDDEGLAEVGALAASLGLALETGTKGVEPGHLREHLRRASRVGAGLVRSMLSSPRGRPTLEDAVSHLREVEPEFCAAGVDLALETYEQFSSAELVGVVDAVASDRVGICLDPGNSVARLEHPMDVVRRCAPHVLNLHVKDFAFTRKEGLVGFTFAGAPLGEGLLDYDAMVDELDRAGRRVNHIVEHWLTRQETLPATRAEEARWVAASVDYLRERGRA